MGNVAQRGHAGLELEAMRRHQSARLIRGEGEEYSIQITLPDCTGRKISDEDHAHFMTRTNPSPVRTTATSCMYPYTRLARARWWKQSTPKEKCLSGSQTFNQEGTDGRPLHLHGILLAAALMYVLATPESVVACHNPMLGKLSFFSPLSSC